MTNFTLSPTFDAANASQKAELLLRRLGVRRNLVGFDYTVYMSVQVAANPSSLQLITKRLYRETAKQFHTTSIAVERAVRTVIGDCWKLEGPQPSGYPGRTAPDPQSLQQRIH